MSGRERKRVVVLGSTGSIGRSTLEIIAALPERFELLAVAAQRNVSALQTQIDQFRPRYASCSADSAKLERATVVDGNDCLTTLATLPEADIVVVATSGHAAIVPTLEGLRAGKTIALANKETIVAAGELVTRVARESPGELRPVDSEHSALWQCLGEVGRTGADVRTLVLTASGGPFRGWSPRRLASVTPEMALKHPNWSMGAKVTIDSATLMNKGLEAIETRWLFDCPLSRIEVAVHPQSLVHALVEFVDGSTLAHVGAHDMRIPIQYALTYPERVGGPGRRLRVSELTRLDFERPDLDAFPLLTVAREAGEAGSTYPTVLSTADVVAVEAFLEGRLSFPGIVDVVKRTLDRHQPAIGELTLEAIMTSETWARATARAIVAEQRGNAA